jgi:hypothetical protein
MNKRVNSHKNKIEKAALSCLGFNLSEGRERGKKGWTGLFYLPRSVSPWKCDHVFETEDGYRHIGDTTSISVA